MRKAGLQRLMQTGFVFLIEYFYPKRKDSKQKPLPRFFARLQNLINRIIH